MRVSDRWLRSLLPIALLTGLLAGLAGPAALSGRAAPQAQLSAANGSVVISEFRSRRPVDPAVPTSTEDNSEFIELYNRTGSTIDIGGWHIAAANLAGGNTFTSFPAFTAGTTLLPGQYFLIANQDAPDALWSNSDWDYAGDITNDGGIALFNASNQKVDAVGMSMGIGLLGDSLSPANDHQHGSGLCGRPKL